MIPDVQEILARVYSAEDAAQIKTFREAARGSNNSFYRDLVAQIDLWLNNPTCFQPLSPKQLGYIRVACEKLKSAPPTPTPNASQIAELKKCVAILARKVAAIEELLRERVTL